MFVIRMHGVWNSFLSAAEMGVHLSRRICHYSWDCCEWQLLDSLFFGASTSSAGCRPKYGYLFALTSSRGWQTSLIRRESSSVRTADMALQRANTSGYCRKPVCSAGADFSGAPSSGHVWHSSRVSFILYWHRKIDGSFQLQPIINVVCHLSAATMRTRQQSEVESIDGGSKLLKIFGRLLKTSFQGNFAKVLITDHLWQILTLGRRRTIIITKLLHCVLWGTSLISTQLLHFRLAWAWKLLIRQNLIACSLQWFVMNLDSAVNMPRFWA